MKFSYAVYAVLMTSFFAGSSCQHNGSGGGNHQEEQTEQNTISRLKADIRSYPDSLPLRMQLAARLRRQGELRPALRQTDTILQKDSLNPALHLFKGELLLELKDTTSGIMAYETAYRIEPLSETPFSLAYLYAVTGNPKALELSDTLIARMTRQNPKGDPYYIKGIYHLQKGNQPEALRSFNQSINIDHTFMESYTEKGRLLFNQKNYRDALKVFQLAATVSNSYPDAYYWQGKCLEEMGEKTTAANQYKKAIGLDPDYKAAREALQKLAD